MESKNEITFSVRQLAQLFGRSEQTVRRWKDQGKLAAVSGADGGEAGDLTGGGLVFTLDAVRDLVQKNPRLLDKAAPELRELLYGDASAGPQKARSSTAATAAEFGALAAGSLLLPGPTLAAAAAAMAYKLHRGRNPSAAEEPGGTAPEAAEGTVEEPIPVSVTGVCRAGKSSYLYQLLLAREQEVQGAINELTAELEQIQKEKAALEADGES